MAEWLKNTANWITNIENDLAKKKKTTDTHNLDGIMEFAGIYAKRKKQIPRSSV